MLSMSGRLITRNQFRDRPSSRGALHSTKHGSRRAKNERWSIYVTHAASSGPARAVVPTVTPSCVIVTTGGLQLAQGVSSGICRGSKDSQPRRPLCRGHGLEKQDDRDAYLRRRSHIPPATRRCCHRLPGVLEGSRKCGVAGNDVGMRGGSTAGRWAGVSAPRAWPIIGREGYGARLESTATINEWHLERT